MIGTALLIGSQTYGLTGVNGDVALMDELFREKEFDVRVCKDGDATRAGIIAAYEQLIAEIASGSTEPVVIYYSGHGGRMKLPGWQELQRAGKRSHLRFLVPFDMAATTETDFRGLLAEEVSQLQRRLTDKTPNVTTILDCCHSATMSRNADMNLIPKALSRALPIEGALPLLEAVDTDAAGRPTGLDDSNALAVRVVACDPLQSAYERDSVALGGRHGALTEQLVIALRALGDRPVSWQVLGARIRSNVSAELPLQRPEIEGPAQRLPFSLSTRGEPGALPVTTENDAVFIEPARLFGIAAGDVFRLVEEQGDDVGTAEVSSVAADRAELSVTWVGDKPGASTSLTAVPVRTHRTRPVVLDVAATVREQLTSRVERSSQLRLAAAGDTELAVATIAGTTSLTVCDPLGEQVTTQQFGADDIGAGQAVALVERMAKAERLRSLASGSTDDSLLRGAVTVELASFDDNGIRTVRSRSGERLYPGEKLSVSITNTSVRTLYVALFDIGTSYNIGMISSDEPDGWRIPAGETKVIGGDGGVALVWDDDVPATGERPETFVIIAATEPQEFGALANPGPRAARGGPPSELESLLAEAGSGVRGWPAAAGPAAVSYRAEAIDFFLTPESKPDVDEPEFAITELPAAEMRSAQPRDFGADTPSRVAVRLVALKVRNNRALFKASVRLDAMVITSAADGKVVATPFTQLFPGVADGDLLSMDNVALYLGEVHDFLDLAVWVNRDDAKGVDLATLFEKSVSDPTTSAALTVVGGLVIAAPQVAVAVGAVAAVATLVRVGASLVQSAVGKHIGLYRTSFLTYERFGAGRHPSEGLREAQGIEFAYDVVDIG